MRPRSLTVRPFDPPPGKQPGPGGGSVAPADGLDRWTRRRLLRWGAGLLGLWAAPVWRLAGCRRPEASGPSSAAGRRPNIIFVLVDALRADRLGAYGGARPLTPTMDALAAAGLTFERAIAAAPWTQPSVASLFCSCYPSVHKVQSYQAAWDSTFNGAPKVAVFGGGFTTLAQALQAGGYETAAFSTNPFVLAEYGYGQGFDHFDGSLASFEKKQTASGAALNEVVFRWLAGRTAAKPLFLYLHYMDVHGPYEGDPAFLDTLLDEVERMPDKRELTAGETHDLLHLRRLPSQVSDPQRHERLMRYREYWVARYDAGVRAMDNYLADLRSRLADMGLWNDAYVALTSDHGEALCEHHFWDHGLSLHDNQLHVPLILHWPGALAAGQRIREMVRLIDVLPTLLDQLGLPLPAGIQGRSVLPLVRGQSSAAAPFAFAESLKSGTEQKAVYRGSRELILVQDQPPRVALFDLANDPQQQNDLSAQDRAAVQELGNLVQGQLRENAQLAATVQSRHVVLGEAERRRLESLGYVGSRPAPTTTPTDGDPDAPAP